jgi:hypothetical protein
MMKLKNIVVMSIAIISLSACATDIMKGYVGKSVTEVMLDYGRPADVFDLPDGRRAFQWSVDSSGVMPITNTNYGTVSGAGGWANLTTTSTSYVPYENTCLYTMTAKEEKGDWIIDGFREPSLMCM